MRSRAAELGEASNVQNKIPWANHVNRSMIYYAPINSKFNIHPFSSPFPTGQPMGEEERG